MTAGAGLASHFRLSTLLDAAETFDWETFALQGAPLDTSAQQWQAVHTLVNDRGGRVILVAGDAHLPKEYSQDPLTAQLLPWTGGAAPLWRDWPGREAGFHAQPARAARDLDALRGVGVTRREPAAVA